MSRTQRIGIAFSAFIAFAVGALTTLSLLLGGRPELYGELAGAPIFAHLLTLPAAIMARLVAITSAVTIVIGISNLLYVHLSRVVRGAFFSIVMIASFALTIWWYWSRQGDTSLLAAVQVPIESALAALLFLSMAQGGARVLNKRADVWGLLFVTVLVVVLLGSLPLESLAPVRAWSDWLMEIPVSAGARAILLGIALGAVVTGLRVLLGQDRSYRG
ncbi:MAG: hypothetical protein OXN94_04050 [Chloroflexota bacterium]|nr:hypothetical protein [Chloroflexota bacterium]MDE2857003.1 hypothetical protein [Chloroflexota bacterium]